MYKFKDLGRWAGAGLATLILIALSVFTIITLTHNNLEFKKPIGDFRPIERIEIEPLKPITKKPVEKAEVAVKIVEKKDNKSVASSATPVAVSGSCGDWIAAAGITDVANAKELISRESGCNPNAVNPSSGACNVAQELPCGKSGCSLGDGACSVRWMHQYVLNRYGGWANAVAFHNANNWY